MATNRTKNKLGQYFTPRHIAGLMLSMAKGGESSQVLEPSAGEGVFLDILQESNFKNITGIEIDSELASKTSHNVINESFLNHPLERKYDLVIGNPPYIRWKDLDDRSKEEFKSQPEWNFLFNSLSDFLIPFISKSIKHLNQGGELIFVTPSFWMHTQHSSMLREWMLTQGNITDIVHFDEASVFPKVASSIIIFRFEKKIIPGRPVNLHTYLGPNKIPTLNLTLENTELFSKQEIPPFTPKSHWTLAPESVQKRLNFFEDSCFEISTEVLFKEKSKSTLGDLVQIANGMVSGLDEAFKVSPELLAKLTEEELSVLIDVTKAYLLKPVFTDEIVHYIDIPNGLTESHVREKFPNLITHLEGYKEDLLKRYSYNRELPFWEWAFRRSESFFFDGKPKAFVPCKERLTSKPQIRFSMVPNGVIATQDVTGFAPRPEIRESLEYIVAFLTLPEVTDWVRYRGLMKGGVAEFSERPLSEIPVRRIHWEDVVEVELHDQITKLFQQLKNDSLGDQLEMVKAMHKLIYQLLKTPISI
jgi:adenine-specific DNA-methyltransferase